MLKTLTNVNCEWSLDWLYSYQFVQAAVIIIIITIITFTLILLNPLPDFTYNCCRLGCNYTILINILLLHIIIDSPYFVHNFWLFSGCLSIKSFYPWCSIVKDLTVDIWPRIASIHTSDITYQNFPLKIWKIMVAWHEIIDLFYFIRNKRG